MAYASDQKTTFKTDSPQRFFQAINDERYGLLELTAVQPGQATISNLFKQCVDLAGGDPAKTGAFIQFSANGDRIRGQQDAPDVTPIEPIIARMVMLYQLASGQTASSLRFQYNLKANVERMPHVHHHYVVNLTSGDLGVCWNGQNGALQSAEEGSMVLIKPFFPHYSPPMDMRKENATRFSLILS